MHVVSTQDEFLNWRPIGLLALLVFHISAPFLCFVCTGKPVCKDHLYTKTTCWFIGHFSDTTLTLYKDHLSTETTVG